MYEKSQDSAEHWDTLLWEVTAIIWSANALLIGFVVEALRTDASPGQRVIVCLTSILAIVLTWVAQRFMRTANAILNLKYEICRHIEQTLVDLPENLREHCRADHLFKQERWKGRQKKLYLRVSIGFTAVYFSTEPMLHAQRGEPIEFFSVASRAEALLYARPKTSATGKELQAAKNKLRETHLRRPNPSEVFTPPTYDDVFSRAIEALDDESG